MSDTHDIDRPAPEPGDDPDHSLRGTFVAVLLLGAFLAACWVGMLAIAMERR